MLAGLAPMAGLQRSFESLLDTLPSRSYPKSFHAEVDGLPFRSVSPRKSLWMASVVPGPSPAFEGPGSGTVLPVSDEPPEPELEAELLELEDDVEPELPPVPSVLTPPQAAE